MRKLPLLFVHNVYTFFILHLISRKYMKIWFLLQNKGINVYRQKIGLKQSFLLLNKKKEFFKYFLK